MEVRTWIFAVSGMAFIILIAALVVVIIVSLIKTWQAKIIAEKDAVYQKILMESEELQKLTLENEQKMQEEMAHLKKHVASIEKMLQEVE